MSMGSADAEDAVQDAYVRALEANLPELNSAQAWLLTVVRNLAIDRLRRRNWMQQWLLAEMKSTHTTTQMTPSTEMDATLAQEVLQALRLIAAHLAPEDGAGRVAHGGSRCAIYNASDHQRRHPGGRATGLGAHARRCAAVCSAAWCARRARARERLD